MLRAVIPCNGGLFGPTARSQELKIAPGTTRREKHEAQARSPDEKLRAIKKRFVRLGSSDVYLVRKFTKTKSRNENCFKIAVGSNRPTIPPQPGHRPRLGCHSPVVLRTASPNLAAAVHVALPHELCLRLVQAWQLGITALKPHLISRAIPPRV